MLRLSLLVNAHTNLTIVINILQDLDEGGVNVLQCVVDVVLNLLNTMEVNSQKSLFCVSV
jgi:hypothetical protein